MRLTLTSRLRYQSVKLVSVAYSGMYGMYASKVRVNILGMNNLKILPIEYFDGLKLFMSFPKGVQKPSYRKVSYLYSAGQSKSTVNLE